MFDVYTVVVEVEGKRYGNINPEAQQTNLFCCRSFISIDQPNAIHKYRKIYMQLCAIYILLFPEELSWCVQIYKLVCEEKGGGMDISIYIICILITKLRKW